MTFDHTESKGKKDTLYVQVQLYRNEDQDHYYYISWIPLKYAVMNKVLSIKTKDGKWENWTVNTVYSLIKMSEYDLIEGERDFLNQRKVSDRIRKRKA